MNLKILKEKRNVNLILLKIKTQQKNVIAVSEI